MNSEKVIDLIKWFVGSVVIVVVTLIIDTGFKEREAGIQEMQVYDKYVDIILQADNIEQRWKLCQYFSIVTPTERLRVRWVAYKDSIQSDYKLWQKSQMIDSTEIGMHNTSLVSSQFSEAKKLEDEGLSAILDNNWQVAHDAFTKAESVYPGYHNCYEISRHLNTNKDALQSGDKTAWQSLVNKIRTDWSWGLTAKWKKRFKN